MKKLIASVLLIAALLIPVSSFPTCIVIYKTKDGTIYFAADSRHTIKEIRSTGNFKDQFVQGCKFEMRNGVYFAIGGHMDTYTQETIERQFKWSNEIRVVEKK